MTNLSPYKINSRFKNMVRMNQFRKFRFGSLSVSSIVAVMFIFLGLFYIVAVNITSTKGGQLQTLQLQKQKVVATNERLALEAARLASLAVIEGGAEEKIEIGDDDRPTGRIITEKETEIMESDEIKEITYVPKMVPLNNITYLEQTGSLAHK